MHYCKHQPHAANRHCLCQGGLGPMQGQANHFVRYAPEKIEYGIKRYTNETKRLYEVMERQLSDGREWLAAGQYTIADMAAFGWVYAHDWAGMNNFMQVPDHHPELL